MGYDCFLSYTSPDLAHAEALYRRLLAAGFPEERIWFDKARLRPGCQWHQEIEEGCEASRVVLALLTPNWKRSEWTRYETYGAETVIPVLVEGPLGRGQHAAPGTIPESRHFPGCRW